MEKYPFIYLNHGIQAIECVGKNEEIFIWFKIPVKKTEQKKIMNNCPLPINFVHQWGKEYVWLGSSGDTYEFEILATYASEENRMIEEMLETQDYSEYDDIMQNGLKKALPLFAKDLELWIIGVNKIAPVAFFMGPHGIEAHDDWSSWSSENVYEVAMPYLKKYRKTYPVVFESENGEQYFFRGIYNDITEYMESGKRKINNDSLIDDVEFAFEIDGISDRFERLNYEDGDLQGNANKLHKILKDFSEKERIERVKKFKPYTQFAFLASYAASRNKDILKIENPVEYLKVLITNLPQGRKKIIGTYLQFISENLVNVGPAVSEDKKNDKTHAGLASQIMEMALSYEDDENAYIYCATFYDWLKDYEAMLKISLKAVKSYPDNNSIIANVIYAAGNCGKPELAEKFVQKKIDDPLIIANQSFALVKSGRLKEAYDLLVGHYKNEGKFNVYSFNNLLYVCNYYKHPEKEIFDDIVEKAEKKFFMDAEYANAEFVNSLVILLGNIMPERAVKVFSSFRKDGGDTTCSLWCNYTYAASKTNDPVMIKKSIDDYLQEYAENSGKFKNDKTNYRLLLVNIAFEYAQLEDKANMLEYLKRVKGIHPDFKSLKKDNDFKDYWDDPDFLKLFE